MIKLYSVVNLDEHVSGNTQETGTDWPIMRYERRFECTDWGTGGSTFLLNDKLNNELREKYISSQLNFSNKSGNGFLVLKSVTIIGKEGLLIDDERGIIFIGECVGWSQEFFSWWIKTQKSSSGLVFRGWKDKYKVECELGQTSRGVDNIYLLKQPGYNIFGHWLLDIVPRLRSIEIYHDQQFCNLMVDSVNEWQSSILRLFTVPDVVENCSCVSFHQNVAIPLFTKVGHGLCHSFCADAWKTLASRMHEQKGFTDGNMAHKKIYISRKDYESGRASCLANANQIEKLLKTKGFFIFAPEKYPLSVQAEIFSNAEIVVGEDGSGLHSIVFQSDPCTLGVLMPSSRTNLWHAGICHSLGHRIAYFGLQRGYRGYNINLKSFARFLESLETMHPAFNRLSPLNLRNLSKEAYQLRFSQKAMKKVKSKLRRALKTIYHIIPLDLKTKRLVFAKVIRLRNRCIHISIDREVGEYADFILRNEIKELKSATENMCFEYSSNPEITIIIPCYDQLNYTISCLYSIYKHPPSTSFEIIVVNDCSPSDDYSIIGSIENVTLIDNLENLGYLESCNQALRLAKGNYIYLLNNDVLVMEGTIDALLETFKRYPNTGLVGSKLLYPNGMLQEAGGIVWQDGSAWNFGRLKDNFDPAYNYMRSVDYCSAASVMLSHDKIRSLEGFDPIYKPAYYEDTDLAFRIRTLGYDVLYQPASKAIHFEGVSHGNDITKGTKSYQETNKVIFYERWKDILYQNQPNGVDIDSAKDRGFHRRVLFIDKCTPSPDRDAGSVVLLNIMLLMRHLGYQPTFIPDDNYANLHPYTSLCQSLGIECLYAPYTTSVKQHLQDLGERYDLVILFRPDLTCQHLKSVRQYCPKAKVLYYPHDLHYIRLERESFLTGRKDLLILSKEMRAIELANSESCDGTIVVSSTELEVLSAELPESRIFHLPLISSSRTKYLPKFGCLNLVFVGNFNHTPNEDAVIWFIDDILPVVKGSLPEIKFYIVGGNPPATITARCSEYIITTDYIDDLDDFFTGMNLSVVPLRFGAGMKGKVLASMRCGLPVVTTSIGCEGMGLKHKKDILISDTVQDFANSIIRVLTERPLWETLSENSIKISEMKWGRAQTISTLKNILMDAGLPVEDDKNLDFFPLYPFS